MAHFMKLLTRDNKNDPIPVLVNMDKVLSISKGISGSILTLVGENDIYVLEAFEWLRKQLETPRRETLPKKVRPS